MLHGLRQRILFAYLFWIGLIALGWILALGWVTAHGTALHPQWIFAGAVGSALLLSAATPIIIRFATRPLQHLTNQIQQQTELTLSNSAATDELQRVVLAFSLISQQSRQQIKALQDERATLNAVLQQMSDGVILLDENGRIRLANWAAEHIFQTQIASIMGHTLAEALRDHRLVELWRQSVHTNSDQMQYLELRRPNIFIQVIVKPLHDTQVGSALLFVKDLTKLRRLETIRRDFVSNISHELRTPLASLKALTETLQDGALEDPPAARRFINLIETEVDALNHMVSELLELSRIESGKVPLELKPTHPCTLLHSAYERLELQATRANLTLTLDCPENLPNVLCDPPRVQQVIVNLLHNAIKFTPSGGNVSLRAWEEDGFVRFCVRDSGIGIPKEDLPRIFERFYKADRARSGGGTGLGLAIARHLVEAHGGKIWAESRQGEGSVFCFSLPAT
ncbi:MAG: hypothetical protein OHK0052_08570 [Anaerolineales bacterium]